MGIPLQTMRAPAWEHDPVLGMVAYVKGWLFTQPTPGPEAPYVVHGLYEDAGTLYRVVGRGGSYPEAIADAVRLARAYHAGPIVSIPWMGFDGDSESQAYAH